MTSFPYFKLFVATQINMVSFLLIQKCNGIYSLFFSKLFMLPVTAEQGNNYFIKYVRSGIMECVINFAYTFICDINEENLCELLSTAEYFCYISLVDRCAEFIKSILNSKNCISLMLMTRFL